MAQVLFDKMSYVDTLTRAGYDPKQARAQAHALDVALHESVATKEDIADVRSEIASSEATLRGEIADVRSEIVLLREETSGKIDLLREETSGKIDLLREETSGKNDTLSAQFTMLQRIVLAIGVGIVLLLVRSFF